MHDELPAFRKVKRSYAASFIHGVLSGPRGSALRQLIEYDDNHYRAIFAADYFQMTDGRSEPSKSQWSTLKKKIKRRNRSAFIFRQHGGANCQTGDPVERCLYLDFGFLLD